MTQYGLYIRSNITKLLGLLTSTALQNTYHRPSHGLDVSINNSLTILVMFKIHYLNMTELCCQWLNNMSHKEMYSLWGYLYAHLIPCWKLWLNVVSTSSQTTTNFRFLDVYFFTKHLPQCLLIKSMDCSFLYTLSTKNKHNIIQLS